MSIKLTIQTIAYNALTVLPEGMLEACIRQWESIADEIIIVHGPTGACVEMIPDGTLDLIKELASHNPKIKIITKDSWPNKTAMCNAAADIATGDYIWQCDSDEFYHEDDIPNILKLLEDKRPDRMDFYAYHFWGGFGTAFTDVQRQWANHLPWMRIHRREPGSYWHDHTPPDLRLKDGSKASVIIDRDQTKQKDIFLYHYGFVHKTQIMFKALYFKRPEYITHWSRWHKDNSYTVMGDTTYPFDGEHPMQIRALLYAQNKG